MAPSRKRDPSSPSTDCVSRRVLGIDCKAAKRVLPEWAVACCSSPPGLLRAVFILLAFSWFLFNAVGIWGQFFRFDTTVSVQYSVPSKTMPPAFSLCTFCLYCDEEEGHPLWVSHVLSPSGPHHNRTEPMLDLAEVVLECALYPKGADSALESCSQVAPVVVSMQEGHKCFTYFSDIYGHMTGLARSEQRQRYQMEFELLPYIALRLSNKFLSWKPLSRKRQMEPQSGLSIVLHSPDVLPSMLELSWHSLRPASMLSVKFAKMVESLKPWPFVTDCHQYTPTHLHQHVHLPDSVFLSNGECILQCLWLTLRNQTCVNFFTIFTEEMLRRDEQAQGEWPVNGTAHMELQFCQSGDAQYQLYTSARKQCLRECHKSCRIETYSIRSVTDLTDVLPGAQDSLVMLEWSTESVISIRHQEKMSLQQFLGNIGGLAHIWLGISAIFLLEGLVRLIRPNASLPDLTRLLIGIRNQ